MLDVYQLLNFDNPDGGSWKQGWDIVYDRQQVESNQPQLQVYLVPHSHDDPGNGCSASEMKAILISCFFV